MYIALSCLNDQHKQWESVLKKSLRGSEKQLINNLKSLLLTLLTVGWSKKLHFLEVYTLFGSLNKFTLMLGQFWMNSVTKLRCFVPDEAFSVCCNSNSRLCLKWSSQPQPLRFIVCDLHLCSLLFFFFYYTLFFNVLFESFHCITIK